jgi:hypothetical protein
VQAEELEAATPGNGRGHQANEVVAAHVEEIKVLQVADLGGYHARSQLSLSQSQ